MLGRDLMLICLLVVLTLASPVLAEPSWERVTQTDGIEVSMREVPGRGFPTFRGVGAIDASSWDVLGVLSDVARYKEWNARTHEARELRKVSDLEYLVYTRTDIPWPLADRDAVYHSTVHVDRKRKTIDIRFQAVSSPLMGPVKGVVRMTRLRGHYRLTALGAQRTLMDLQVDADPGGWVPKWLAKMGTRSLPIETIQRLRRQVRRTQGWYNERIRRWQALEKTL